MGVDEIDLAEEHCAQEPSIRGCSPYVNDLAEIIMDTAEEAHDLYIAMLTLTDDL